MDSSVSSLLLVLVQTSGTDIFQANSRSPPPINRRPVFFPVAVAVAFRENKLNASEASVALSSPLFRQNTPTAHVFLSPKFFARAFPPLGRDPRNSHHLPPGGHHITEIFAPASYCASLRRLLRPVQRRVLESLDPLCQVCWRFTRNTGMLEEEREDARFFSRKIVSNKGKTFDRNRCD